MNINDMTVAQLRETAAELSIAGRSKMKKADLIGAIEAAQINARSIELFEQATRVEEGTEADKSAAQVGNRVRVDFDRTRPGQAFASMMNQYGISTNTVAVRKGKTWEISGHVGHDFFVVKARSFEKLAKRWAAKLGNWADDIRVVREF